MEYGFKFILILGSNRITGILFSFIPVGLWFQPLQQMSGLVYLLLSECVSEELYRPSSKSSYQGNKSRSYGVDKQT